MKTVAEVAVKVAVVAVLALEDAMETSMYCNMNRAAVYTASREEWTFPDVMVGGVKYVEEEHRVLDID